MYKSIDSSRVRNLKLIARLKAGDKLCTRYHHYSIDTYGPFSYRSVVRYLNGESRSETIDSLTQLIESCVKQHGISQDERRRLANEFREVVKGVKNLSITYKDDSTACVGLDLIREMMEEYIDMYGDKITYDEGEGLEGEAHPIVDEGITRTTEDDIDLETEEVVLDD